MIPSLEGWPTKVKEAPLSRGRKSLSTTIHIWILRATRCSWKKVFSEMQKEGQVKKFLYRRKFIFCSQNSRVFAFLTIPLFSKSMMPWWVLVHETGGLFKYIFWTTTGHDQKIWDTFWLNYGHWYKVLNLYQLLYQFKIRVKIIFLMSLENDNSLTLWKSHFRRTK